MALPQKILPTGPKNGGFLASHRNFGSIPPLIQLLRKKLMGLVHPQVADAPEIATHPVFR